MFIDRDKLEPRFFAIILYRKQIRISFMQHFTTYYLKALDNFENINCKVAIVIVVDNLTDTCSLYRCFLFNFLALRLILASGQPIPGDGKLRLSLTTTFTAYHARSHMRACMCGNRKFFAVFHIIGRLDRSKLLACRLEGTRFKGRTLPMYSRVNHVNF